jgi:hypothetical protein
VGLELRQGSPPCSFVRPCRRIFVTPAPLGERGLLFRSGSRAEPSGGVDRVPRSGVADGWSPCCRRGRLVSGPWLACTRAKVDEHHARRPRSWSTRRGSSESTTAAAARCSRCLKIPRASSRKAATLSTRPHKTRPAGLEGPRAASHWVGRTEAPGCASRAWGGPEMPKKRYSRQRGCKPA